MRGHGLDQKIGDLHGLHRGRLLKRDDIGRNLGIVLKALINLAGAVAVPEVGYVAVFLRLGDGVFMNARLAQNLGERVLDNGRLDEIVLGDFEVAVILQHTREVNAGITRAVKVRELLAVEREGDLLRAVAAEVEENDAVAVCDLRDGLTVMRDDERKKVLIDHAGVFGAVGLDGFLRRAELTAFALHVCAPALFDHRPVGLIAVHRDDHAAAAGSDLVFMRRIRKRGKDGFQLVDILQSARRGHITAIEQNVALANMSIEAFRNYLDFYEENRPLREQFTQTEQFSFGFFSGGILLDTEHRLLRLKYGDGAFAFTAENFACFRIYEDGRLLMEGKTGSLDLYRSEVPAILKKLAPKVLAYLREKREYERFEELERMLEKNGDSSSTRRLRRSEPRFDEPAPVRQFELEIQLRHPYWGSFRQKISAPVFMHDEPNLDDYKRDYEQKVTELHTLAVNLMKILDPSAPEHRNVGGTDSEKQPQTRPQPAPQTDTVTELKRYKELLDAGILSEEEFTAKKKQLLGI